MFCPHCGQYTTAVEVERIAPEGDIIYPLAHYQLSYKDTFLYVVGHKFMNSDGRASKGEFLRFFLLWLLVIVGILALAYGLTAVLHRGIYLILLAWMLLTIIGLVLLIPLGALCIRRLHDTGKSSEHLFFVLIPFIGPIILFALLCKKGEPKANQYGEALRNIVIDKRLASIMKVSPTSSAFTTRILVALLVSAICVCSVSARYMGPESELELGGWFTNIIVGQGSDEAARDAIHDYFDAVNEKNYDKAFTYVINQTKTNPVEKQKWMESMKSAPKVVVGSLGASRITRINSMKRIIYEADLQVTKPGDGAVEAAHMTATYLWSKKMANGILKDFIKVCQMINNEMLWGGSV